MRPRLRGIYAIVDGAEGDVLAQVADVLAAGVRLVQYRSKAGIDRAVLAAARERAHAAGAILIVNDDLRLLDDADGIHLGQEDLAPLDVKGLRARVGTKILGISAPDAAAARAAVALGADYVGVGSMYATRTKSDAGAPIGPQGVRRVVEAVAVPVAAIGGITLANIAEVRATGAAMAAVITAISRAPDRRAAARALVEAWAR
jgi:thiamine-phosphate pyrophosphorylase